MLLLNLIRSQAPRWKLRRSILNPARKRTTLIRMRLNVTTTQTSPRKNVVDLRSSVNRNRLLPKRSDRSKKVIRNRFQVPKNAHLTRRNAVSQVPRSLSPRVPRSLSPQVSRSLSPQVQRSLSPQVPISLSPQVPRRLSPQVPRRLSPQVPRKLSPQRQQNLRVIQMMIRLSRVSVNPNQLEIRRLLHQSRSPSRQVSKSPSPQVSKSPSQQVPRSPSQQVPKSPSRQVSKSPSQQVLKSLSQQVPRSPNLQLLKSQSPELRSPSPSVLNLTHRVAKNQSLSQQVPKSPSHRVVSQSPSRLLKELPQVAETSSQFQRWFLKNPIRSQSILQSLTFSRRVFKPFYGRAYFSTGWKAGGSRQPKKKAPKIEKSPLASVVSDECSESDSNWEEPSASDASDPEPSASDTSGSEASEQEPSEVSSSKKKPAEKSPKVKVEKSSGYDVVEDAGWKAGEPVPFLALARAFKRVESISGRLKTIEVMANLFRSVIALTPEEFLPIIYLCVNKIAPPYENLEVGVGDGLLYKAIELTTGRKMSQLKTAVEEQGDLGIVAEQCRGKQRLMFKPKPLTCRYVFDTIKSLSQIEGNKSRDKKIGLINKLFVSARESEARYIVRSLQGKMRLGFSEQSVLVAIARACALTPPAQSGTPPEMLDTAKQLSKSKFEKRFSESEKIIKRVYSEVPNWDMVIPNLMSVGLEVLPEKCFLTPGIPIKAMLAKPTKGIQEILERFANLLFTLEYKYDGERIQVHYLGDGKFEFFSRNAERSTGKFPDIQAYLPNVFDKEKVESFIIDCEVVAWDIEKKKILPFQTLSTRKRKDVNTKDITVQVCLFAFDCLYMNGESLLQKPFMDRRAALHDNFEEKPGQLMFATNRDTSDPEDIQTFLDEAIRASCEGLMVKTLKKEATYEPSKRSHSWLKVKKDYLSGCMDSLDLVPIGGYHGKGKRAGVFGAYLVACYDPDREEYQAICKIGTGLKDDFLASSSKFFADGHTIAKPPSYFRLPDTTSDRPDAWFEPCQVWEVKCADLSLSPKYFAAQGLVSERKGIALRFPRFIRIREDKNVEDATNSEQVADMYKSQAVVS
eukprot:245854_1